MGRPLSFSASFAPSQLRRGAAVQMERLCTATAQAMYLLLPLLPAVVLSGLVLRYDLLTWSRGPIDNGAAFRGRRLFGDNKTWRGVVCMVAGCILTVALQKYVIKDRAGDWAVI